MFGIKRPSKAIHVHNLGDVSEGMESICSLAFVQVSGEWLCSHVSKMVDRTIPCPDRDCMQNEGSSANNGRSIAAIAMETN